MGKELLWGFIDKSGEYVIEPRFHDARDFHEDLAVVKVEWARGYIDRSGAYVIEPRFQAAGDFIDGLALVMDDNLYGFIDREGHYVIEPKYEKAEEFHDGVARVMTAEGWIYIDRTGAPVAAPETTAASEDSPTAAPSIAVGMPAAQSFSDGLAPSREGDKEGFVDEEGKFVIAPKFAQVEPFSEGLAAVRTTANGKWGYIDRDGKQAFK
ncbi:MAG: WG repeat-containing protein, partial [Muribaculaceae bacterium]|nr:WG repeat-containing protein [Muribaculaceae bacterium]